MDDQDNIIQTFTELAPHYEEVVDAELGRFWGWSYAGREPAKLSQTGQLQWEHLQLLADKLYEKNLELEKTNERLRNLSLTDEPTGLNNRRGFMILANSLLKLSRRANHP